MRFSWSPSFWRASRRFKRTSSVRTGVPVISVLVFGKKGAHSLKPSMTVRTIRAVKRLAFPGTAFDS